MARRGSASSAGAESNLSDAWIFLIQRCLILSRPLNLDCVFIPFYVTFPHFISLHQFNYSSIYMKRCPIMHGHLNHPPLSSEPKGILSSTCSPRSLNTASCTACSGLLSRIYVPQTQIPDPTRNCYSAIHGKTL